VEHEAKSSPADRPRTPHGCRRLTHAGKSNASEPDKTLWTDADEDNGWAGSISRTANSPAQTVRDLAAQIKHHAYTDAVLLAWADRVSAGSTVPHVRPGRRLPCLSILDSTDPAQVKSIETMADPATTLYIVSSKSGSTLEPNIFKDYFSTNPGATAAAS